MVERKRDVPSCSRSLVTGSKARWNKSWQPVWKCSSRCKSKAIFCLVLGCVQLKETVSWLENCFLISSAFMWIDATVQSSVLCASWLWFGNMCGMTDWLSASTYTEQRCQSQQHVHIDGLTLTRICFWRQWSKSEPPSVSSPSVA